MAGGLAQCPDCPYRGKTKDLNAHRRLHKQRPGAVYKCPECPYWVNHNRLLQQHAKVGGREVWLSEPASIIILVEIIEFEQNYENLCTILLAKYSLVCKEFLLELGVSCDLYFHNYCYMYTIIYIFLIIYCQVHSPRYRQKVYQQDAFSLGETSLEDVAAFKQHLISSKVAPVKLEPGTFKRQQLQCHKVSRLSDNHRHWNLNVYGVNMALSVSIASCSGVGYCFCLTFE